jgi:hypothetical protein
MDGTIRVRTAAWFATAVVISVFATLLVMQEWRADAAPGDSDATWVAVEPCRLFDYRPGKEPLDGKKTPLVAGAPATQQVTGTVGNCTIPTDGVVAVSMNVTIVSPTAQSNLRLYPADAASEPVVSNLNWLAGDSATPNKVDVKLSAAGAVKIAVANGTVDVVGDVVGYYTKAKAGASAFAGGQSSTTLGPDAVVKSVSLMPTADGQVLVNSSGYLLNLGVTAAPFSGRCSITTGTTVDTSALELSDVQAGFGFAQQLGSTRGFDVTSGALFTVNYVCDLVTGSGAIDDAALTAIFVPTP